MLCAPDYLERDVYLCGPPVMMDIVVKVLRELKIPEKQIHFEKFSY
jgi:ferredoxin-NADP reductase